jgi:hypothetical protein
MLPAESPKEPWAEKRQPGSYYEIVIQGHLEQHWNGWFNGMTIHNLPSGEVILSGLIVDQAALHGILIKIFDLGMISLSRL